MNKFLVDLGIAVGGALTVAAAEAVKDHVAPAAIKAVKAKGPGALKATGKGTAAAFGAVADKAGDAAATTAKAVGSIVKNRFKPN
jgi:hypothetical protein